MIGPGFSHSVPPVDSTNNILSRDVTGNRNDGHSTKTLAGYGHKNDDHNHSQVFLHPELSAPVVLQSAAGVYAAYPTPTEIVAAGEITEDFDFHFMNISTISANGDYSISLYKGAPGDEIRIGCYSAFRNAVQSQEGTRPIMSPLFPAGTRISAALTSSNAGQNTLGIKLERHPY